MEPPEPERKRSTVLTGTHIGRRGLLAGAATTAMASGVHGRAGATDARPVDRRRHLPASVPYPFTLGIASGDPARDGVVLWTRLACSPVDDDGMGGMSTRHEYLVEWELATDEQMTRIVRRGAVSTDPRSAHSVHIELEGLRPDGEYFYRFRCGRHVSPVGRTRTAPVGRGSTCRIGVASCQARQGGYYTAYRHLVADRPDVVFFLGDYIYESNSDDQGRYIRDHVGPRPLSLASYRQRHGLYKTDPDLQAAHAIAPWMVIFDDHEVENGWAGEVNEPRLIKPYSFERQRQNAFQAYYEHMPLRAAVRPRGARMQLFRGLAWGELANFYALDTRQYRTGPTLTAEQAVDPTRTKIGKSQERWLLDHFAKSSARWNLMLNQAMFVRCDRQEGEGERLLFETWDGYQANRQRVIDGIVGSRVSNPVIFTGNQHRNFVSDVRDDFRADDGSVIATEFVGTSISSGRNGIDRGPADEIIESENPWIRFGNQQRGYLIADVGRQQMEVSLRVLPYVIQPGAPVSTRAVATVEAGRPGIAELKS